MKIEIYYNKQNDCIQMIQDNELKYYDEYIDFEWLCYFNIKEVEEFKNLTASQILKGYEEVYNGFKYHIGESEFEEYLNEVKKESIQGELITIKYN